MLFAALGEDKETWRGGDKEKGPAASPPRFLLVSLSPPLLVFLERRLNSTTHN
jgi:hypothetical protein